MTVERFRGLPSFLLVGALAMGCSGDSLYEADADQQGPNGGQPVSNRAPTANLGVQMDGAMAPVQALILLRCTDPDGDLVTHLLSYSGSSNYDVSSDAVITISRAFGQTVEIRGACRDTRGAMSSIARYVLRVVNAVVQRDSVVLLTNAARGAIGVAALTLDPQLNAVAQAHARDMAERGYFGHTTPEGKTLAHRLRDAGVTTTFAGENIAQNNSAQEAINAWLNSTGHRQNIQNSAFRRLGVGAFRTPTSAFTFYVQVFTN